MRSGPKYDMGPNRPDNFGTPDYAVLPLRPYIPHDSLIWDCAAGDGHLARALRRKDLEVCETSIEQGYDFLTYDGPSHDMIITNPPYTLKDKFLSRCYELGKPFALLMPITCLEGQARQRMYRMYGIQIIMPYGRVNYITPVQKLSDGNGSSAWFYSAWFTWGLDLPSDLMFRTEWKS